MFCPICNRKFTKKAKARRQTYCSNDCAKNASKFKKKLWEKHKLEQGRTRDSQTKTCVQCSEQFESYFFGGKKQKFCSNFCRIEYHKLRRLEKKRQSTLIEPRDCSHCGNTFTPKYTPNHDRQVHCSNNCNVEYHKEQARVRSEEIRKGIVKQCPICDIEFTPEKTLKQIYCSERCRKTIGRRIYSMMQRYRDVLGSDKSGKSQELLGYTPKQLLEHLQTFPNWNSLKNKSWHLDHRIPIIAFVRNGVTDPAMICHLSNIQPLAASDNCSKNDTFDQMEFERYMEQFV